MLEEVQIPLPNAATFWDMEMSHGIRGFIDALPDQIQAEFKARVFQGLTQLEEHDGSVLDRAAYFFKALKPT